MKEQTMKDTNLNQANLFHNFKPVKNSRDFAYELIDRTYETHESLLRACLSYMSTDDVTDMLRSNDCVDCFTENYLEEFGIRKS
jgi:hypothetical protein